MDRIFRETAHRFRYRTRRIDWKFAAAVIALGLVIFVAILLYRLTRI